MADFTIEPPAPAKPPPTAAKFTLEPPSGGFTLEPPKGDDEGVLKSAALSVPRGIASAAAQSWDDLKSDYQAQFKKAPADASLWDKAKSQFDSLVSTGKLPVDAFNLAISPITGALHGAVSVPVSKATGGIVSPEDVDFAMNAARPGKGGLRPPPRAAKPPAGEAPKPPPAGPAPEIKPDAPATPPGEPPAPPGGVAATPEFKIEPPQTTQAVGKELPAEAQPGFTTAKGSKYQLHDDGTTTRDKAFRAEHGEQEQGPQPRSEKTYFVSADDANKLSRIQAQNVAGDPVLATTKDGKLGVKYTTGPNAGKFERGTLVTPSATPAQGMTPVEVWDGGKRTHFGNAITDVTAPKPQASSTAPGTPTEPPAQAVEAAKSGAPPKVVERIADSSAPGGGPPNPPIKEPPESIPPGPGDPKVPDIKGFVRDTEDRLYQISKSGTADKSEMGNKLKALDPHAKDPATQERIYDAIEEKKTDQLSPKDKKVFDEEVAPVNAEEDRIYAKLKNNGVTLDRDGYVHRMVRGKQPKFDPRDPETAMDDVVAGSSRLPQSASGLKDRVYLALDDGKGGRKVIATNKDGTAIYEGGKSRSMGERLAGLKPGDDVTIDGQRYTVEQATTKEIEVNTDTRYYKNALVNSVENLLQLRRVERAVDFLNSFKQDERFLDHAVKAGGNRPIPQGWVQTKLPQMEGWYMDPKIAHALDDFYGQRDAGWEWLTKANRFLTTSMFIDPVPHIHNVANHWFVARGWDNFTPKTWKRSATNGARALTQVMTQGKEYQQFLRDGGGLLYGDVANRNFYELMLKTMGQQVTQDPERWGALAKALGLNRAADLTAALYRASSKALWAGSDVFMMQRYYDLLDKGMSRAQAIHEAERHIPNYRIPSEVLNSRGVSTFLRNSNVINFGRYRYGQLKSYFHMIRDMVKNDRPGARMEAAGNMASLGVLAILVYPFADWALRQLTGNDETKLRRAGASGVAQNMADVTTGEKTFMQALQSLIVPAPATTLLAELASGRNFFTGHAVLEPADQKALVASIESGDVDGVVKSLKRLSAQGLQELATKLYPLGQAEQVTKDDDGGLRRMAERLLDVQEKSPRQVSGKEKGNIIQRRQANTRAKSMERNYGVPLR